MVLRESAYTSQNRWLVPDSHELPKRKLWQGYVLTEQERQNIDHLIGRALLDSAFCQRLLHHRDGELLAEFDFTPETELWLCSLQVNTLAELAQAVTS